MKVGAEITTVHHGNPKGTGTASITLKCEIKDGIHEKEYKVDTQDTTKNELALIAVITALKKLTKPCEVDVMIDNIYVSNQIKNLDKWEHDNWSRSGGKELKNKTLWQQLQMLRKIHKIRFVLERKKEENAKYNATG